MGGRQIEREIERDREREREKTVVSSSNTQQGETQPLVNRHAPLKISYCTLKREKEREREIKIPFVQIKGTFSSTEKSGKKPCSLFVSQRCFDFVFIFLSRHTANLWC